MRLNYYYNFKNNIRFFINIENIIFPDEDFKIDKISWAMPFKFRIRKDDNSFRTLKIPNIYNFKSALEIYKEELLKIDLDLEKIEELDKKHKRMKIDYDLGEFKENSYDENQIIDFNLLVKYDKLIRLDIKSYYKSLYTHYIFKDIINKKKIDIPISRMNNGRTAGIIMGNYLSLYMVELFTTKLVNYFEKSINNEKIDCSFSYFSDDFYIFCFNNDVKKVIELFDKVLEKFDLEKNEEKIETFDYISYTKQDVIEKYWKSITLKCKKQYHEDYIKRKNAIAEGKVPKLYSNLFFTNQLIYKLQKINDFKKQKVFIVNFFKSNFFYKIDFKDTYFDDYNYHQICFLIKTFPEIILYIDSIFDDFEEFKSVAFINTVKYMFKKSLLNNFHDEQLYYFCLLYKLDCINELRNNEFEKLVLDSENQLLISYFIKYSLFEKDFLNKLKERLNEEYWFVSYNLILNNSELFNDLDNSIINYLIPKNASKKAIKNNYLEFYKENLSKKKEILNDIEEVKKEIKKYLFLKWKKRNY